MLLNLRALAHSNMTDVEISRTPLHFAPRIKYRGPNRDPTTEMATTYIGDTFMSIPEEERRNNGIVEPNAPA
jgi:hypothetical protein